MLLYVKVKKYVRQLLKIYHLNISNTLLPGKCIVKDSYLNHYIKKYIKKWLIIVFYKQKNFQNN